jgi:hypothetical protein
MEGSVVQKGILCFEIPIEGGLLPDFVLRTNLTRIEGWGPRAWRLEVRRLFSCCKRLRVHQELHFYGPNKKCEIVARLGVNEHVQKPSRLFKEIGVVNFWRKTRKEHYARISSTRKFCAENGSNRLVSKPVLKAGGLG